MKDLFNSFEDFQEEQANVFNFHNKITDTIVHLLQKTGTILIPEDEQDRPGYEKEARQGG